MGGRKGIRPVKNGGWWRWALVCPDGAAPSRWSVCLPLLIIPCKIKSRNSLLALAHPGGPGKKGRKTIVVLLSSQTTTVAVSAVSAKLVSWWCNGHDVGLATEKFAVRVLAITLSGNDLRQVVHI